MSSICLTSEASGTDLLDALDAAVLGFDGSRRCRTANKSARSLFSAFDPVNHSASAIFAEWPSPPELKADSAATVLVHADGRRFSCSLSGLDDGGTCLSLVDISQHLTEAETPSRDSLTGLIHRSTLEDRLRSLVAGATGFAVHSIDLDRFKSVNDTLGHAIGDALLAKVGDRLRNLAKGNDIVARLGGDEFVIVQTRVDALDDVQAFAARLTDLLSRTFVLQGHMVNVGASVGVALFPDHGTDAETLMRHADLALYRAKGEGRGTARFFEPAMNARMQARRLLEVDLRRALALRQFRLVFQPLVQLSTDRIGGFEALLRWEHPERGFVSPADFIPLAEEVGLITPIGEWVLRTACREAVSWPYPATVAVNISPVQFKSGKLVQTITSALAQAGLPPERLEVEITEGALLDETNLVVSALNALRALGVKVSMDDFGTGYSSLSYLRKFPFDKIKIDQSFVRGLGENSDCDAIVRAVAGLGASLGIRTTAEGVETPEQLTRVRDQGCTEVQGYLTGRPLAAADVAAWLTSQGRGE